MKKILIISELFYPENVIGALRPTKIAKYLSLDGFVVDVITKEINDNNKLNNDDLGCRNLWRVSSIFTNQATTNYCKTLVPSIKYSKNPLILELKKIKRNYYTLKSNKLFYKNVLLFLKKHIDLNEYDTIFTSYGPLSSIMVGLWIKKNYPNLKWICDFRDPIITDGISKLFYPLFKKIQDKACEKSDYVVAVSEGYLKKIWTKDCANKSYVITNGFDLDDSLYENMERIKNDKMHLVYVGAYYEGRRDLTPVFSAVSDLIRFNLIDKNKICFDYAGNDFYFFEQNAIKYSLSDVLVNHSMLSRQDCLKLQYQSDVLLLSTWNTSTENGVLPGKLLEYMLIRKPIISITTGGFPNSEVSSIIKLCNLGLAYESCNREIDEVNLKKYILNLYNEWKEQETISFLPYSEEIDKYNYMKIIKQIEELI